MTRFTRLSWAILALGMSVSGVVGCGGPAHTETTTTTSTDHPTSGGEVHRTSTETTQTQSDGAQTVEHTETTQTSTPPPQ